MATETATTEKDQSQTEAGRERARIETNGDDPRSARAKVSDLEVCLLYTSPSPRDGLLSRMPSSA